MKPLTENEWNEWSYSDLIDAMQVQIIHQVNQGAYEGETYVLIRDGDRYGLLIFGWGSCSGCDALEACVTIEEATDLLLKLWNDIHWESSSDDMLTYMSTKDWDLEWLGQEPAGRKFVTESIGKLRELTIPRD